MKMNGRITKYMVENMGRGMDPNRAYKKAVEKSDELDKRMENLRRKPNRPVHNGRRTGADVKDDNTKDDSMSL